MAAAPALTHRLKASHQLLVSSQHLDFQTQRAELTQHRLTIPLSLELRLALAGLEVWDPCTRLVEKTGS